MSNKKNKVKHNAKEEEQGNKVVKIIFIALVVLGAAFIALAVTLL